MNLSWTSGYMGSYGAGNGEIIGYTDTSGNTQYIDVTSVTNEYAVTGLATATSYTFTVASAVFPSGGASRWPSRRRAIPRRPAPVPTCP